MKNIEILVLDVEMNIGSGRADAEERENMHKGQQKEVQLCMEMNAYDLCT